MAVYFHGSRDPKLAVDKAQKMALERSRTFASLIREYRRAAQMTQETLAERAGLSVRALRKLESGTSRVPRRDTVDLLAAALKLTADKRTLLEASASSWRPLSSAAASNGTAPMPGTNGPRREETALVGRTRELALLEKHLAGEGLPLLMLAGEPGIGKTRLLRETVLLARKCGATVLEGGCHRLSAQEPYAPLLAALASSLRSQPLAQLRRHLEGCAWLVRLLPELAESALLPAPTWTLPPAQERRLMFTAVGRFLANIAGPAQVLLVLDDLQWAGADTLDLLNSLVRGAAASEHSAQHLRVVGAYRDTDVALDHPLPLLLADLARESMAVQATIGPLERQQSAELLFGLLAKADITTSPSQDPSLETALDRTGGVPYFIISCAQEMQVGTIADSSMQPNGKPEPAASIPVQWSVAQSIRLRVAMLGPTTAEVLAVSAVAGRTTHFHVLLAAAKTTMVDDASVVAALEAACHAKLLTETEDGSYSFTHDIVRDVVLAGVSAARTMALHRRVAEAFEHVSAVSTALASVEKDAFLAHHYGRAGMAEREIVYLERAGDRARDLRAHAEAVGYYQKLTERLVALGWEARTAPAREKLSDMLRIQVRYDEALVVLEEATETYRGLHDWEGVARAMAKQGRVHVFRGTPQDGVERLSQILATMEGGELSSARAMLHVTVAELLLFCGRFEEQEQAAARGSQVAHAVHDMYAVVHAQMRRMQALLLLGRIREGMEVVVETMPAIEEVGDLTSLRLALFHAAMMHELLGALEDARRLFSRAVEVSVTLGDPTLLAATLLRHGLNAYYLGEWATARSDFDRAARITLEVGPSWVSACVPCGIGLLQLASGSSETESHALREALEVAERTNDQLMAPNVHGALAECDLLQGNPEDAHRRLEPLLARVSERSPYAAMLLPVLARANYDLGRIAQAEALVLKGLDIARSENIRLALVDGLRVRAHFAIGQRRLSEAHSSVEEAQALCQEMVYPYAEAKVLYVYGQVYVAEGDVQSAYGQYQQALDICDRLGEGLYRPYIEHALAEAIASRR